MTTKLALPGSRRMPRSRLPIYSNKESKLNFCFKPRASKSVQGDAGVVELTFQTPISRKYSCVLCRSLLRDPCQVTCCGSSYCRECVDRLSTTSGKCASKDCGKNYAIITDGPTVEELERKIMQQLKVYCLLRDGGCKWCGTIEQLEKEHMASTDYDKHDTLACQYQEVDCPNRCGAIIPRGNVVEHRLSDCENEVSMCEYCGMEDNSYVIYKVHQKVCPSVPVECPNKCGVPGTVRSEVLVHLENECPIRLVSCGYRHVGCEEQVRFVNLNEHNTASYQKHLDLMSEKLEFVSNENNELREENDKLQNDVATFVSKLRYFQAGIGTVEDILEHYDSMEPAQGDIECLPSSCSSGSINTLIGESSEEEDSESGYNSVVNELSFRGNPETGLESTPSFINSENPYINIQVGRSNHSAKVLADLCPNVQITKECPVSLPASGKPKEGYSVLTIGNSLGNGKAARSTSLPEGGNVHRYLVQLDDEQGLSGIAENVDGLSVARTHNRSFPDRSAAQDRGGLWRPVTPDPFDESSDSSSPESPASEQNGVDVDPWKITIPQLDEEGVPTGEPRVTFRSHVDVMAVDDQEDDFDVQEDGVEATPHFNSTTPLGGRQEARVTSKKNSKSNDSPSRSTVYALPIPRPKSMAASSSSPLMGYIRKISEAARSRNHSSRSGYETPPPLPPKTSRAQFENDTGTLLVKPVPPVKPSTIGVDSDNTAYPFLSKSKISPIPIQPPKIGSLSSSDIGPTPSLESPWSSPRRTPSKCDDTDSPLEPLSASLNIAPTPPPRASKTLPTRDSKPSPTRSSKIPSGSKTSPNSGSRWRPLPPPRSSRTLSSSVGTSRPLRHSFLGGSTASIPASFPVNGIDMEELKNALKGRSVYCD